MSSKDRFEETGEGLIIERRGGNASEEPAPDETEEPEDPDED